MGIEPSVARAVGTAGSAVVFAGATVIIALVALLVTGVPFLGQMGIAAASTIAVAVLLSLTLVPALMAFAGPRATRGKSSSAALHGFGPGFNGPLTIAAEVPPGGGAQRAADATAAELERFDGVASVSPAQLTLRGIWP